MVNVWRCGDDGRLDDDEEEEHLPVSPFRIEASDENGVWLGGWQALVPCLLRMRQQNNGGTNGSAESSWSSSLSTSSSQCVCC